MTLKLECGNCRAQLYSEEEAYCSTCFEASQAVAMRTIRNAENMEEELKEELKEARETIDALMTTAKEQEKEIKERTAETIDLRNKNYWLSTKDERAGAQALDEVLLSQKGL